MKRLGESLFLPPLFVLIGQLDQIFEGRNLSAQEILFGNVNLVFRDAVDNLSTVPRHLRPEIHQ